MKKNEKSPKFLNQRRFYLVVPLVVFPFLTLFFWSLGGGQTTEAESKITAEGLNTSIPDAYIKKDEKTDKMTFYTMAKRDSDLRKSRVAADPYSNNMPGSSNMSFQPGNDQFASTQNRFNETGLNASVGSRFSGQDSNEQKVYQKLDQLNYALHTQNPPLPVQDKVFQPSAIAGMNSADIDRLEKMIQTIGQKEKEDPELQQINTMLEKILDVQHPDRMQEKLKKTSEKKRGQVFPVSASNSPNQAKLFTGSQTSSSTGFIENLLPNTGFYSLDLPLTNDIQENAITAVVHDDQVLVSGSTVKLRLTTDIYINGVLIAKDSFLFGIASLSGDRLNIVVSSIQHKNSLFPVSLTVFDLDGLPGIFIPDAISRTVAKQSADQALNSLGLSALDPSLGAQAASAGIEAAKSLVSKKVRLVKVTVKSGYQVLLRDSQVN